MPSRPSRRARVRRAAVATLACVALAPVAGAHAAPPPTLTIAATSSSIAVAGATQAGGVNVVSSATAVKEASVVLVLLKPGASAGELIAFLSSPHAKDPNGVSRYGAIVFDDELGEAGKAEAQTTLQEGHYVAVLIVGEGAAKAESAFTVTAASAPVALPAPQATERTIEFGFRGPSTLRDGELVRFENEGWLVHMDFAFPVKSRKAAQQVVSDLLAGKERQAGKLIAGPPVSFAGPLSTGGYQQETIGAKPGLYVQVCFMDTQDGRSHTRLGMERIIKIVK